jgi:hypothetical protein
VLFSLSLSVASRRRGNGSRNRPVRPAHRCLSPTASGLDPDSDPDPDLFPAAERMGTGARTGARTQRPALKAATPGFIPLPRWGIGDRAYDGPRAGAFTRGRF